MVGRTGWSLEAPSDDERGGIPLAAVRLHTAAPKVLGDRSPRPAGGDTLPQTASGGVEPTTSLHMFPVECSATAPCVSPRANRSAACDRHASNAATSRHPLL